MRRLSPWFALTYFFLAGCSYLSGVGDFFDRDENKQDAKELAAKVAKTAGENSESPESAVTDPTIIFGEFVRFSATVEIPAVEAYVEIPALEA